MDNSQINIVAVDDTQINILMLTKLLETDGYNVKSFYSADGVVPYLQKNKTDLLLLDIMMPDVDGFELCANIKEVEELKDIPVIFISAKNEEEDKVHGFKLGAVDYVEKPFKALELLSRVRTHVQAQIYKDKLEQMNLDKDKFLSILSHDLRGPFTSILGNLELLDLEDITEDNAESVQSLITDIGSSAKHFYRLLEDLLQWGLVQRGKIVVKKEELKVLDLFEIVEMLYKNSLKKKDIELVIDCEENTMIFADRFMIKEALGNLVSNAIKFTNRGGRIILSATDINDEVTLTISDNGVGMEPSQMKLLFSITSSTSTKGTEKETGTGLGMILVDEFINRNDAKIDVISEVGKGTSFVIVFKK